MQGLLFNNSKKGDNTKLIAIISVACVFFYSNRKQYYFIIVITSNKIKYEIYVRNMQPHRHHTLPLFDMMYCVMSAFLSILFDFDGSSITVYSSCCKSQCDHVWDVEQSARNKMNCIQTEINFIHFFAWIVFHNARINSIGFANRLIKHTAENVIYTLAKRRRNDVNPAEPKIEKKSRIRSARNKREGLPYSFRRTSRLCHSKFGSCHQWIKMYERAHAK